MTKKQFILTLCLFALLAFPIIAWKSSYFSQTTISISDVDSVVINDTKSDSLYLPSKKLTAAQIKQFADDWNKAKSIGPCKYLPQYRLTVYLNDGTQRNFRANGKTIKEKTDYGFRMKEENYFKHLYENAK
ncbi:hypothetical protein BH11BAC7_BH11BAC7_09900 [soil metagenome]